MIIRTEQILIKDDRFSSLCHISKNLWNEANYVIREEFFNNNRWIRYNELAGIFRKSDNYEGFPAQSLQQLLRILDKSWKATFKGIKEWKKYPEKFLGRPKLPNYKDKDSETIVIFTNQQCSIQDGYLTFPKNLNFEPIKTRLPNWSNLREVRIIPKGTGYICEIVYKKVSEEGIINRRWYSKINNQNRIIGIDVGLRNIITIANNIGEKPIIVKGGVLKSINQFYNKEKAQLQSIYDIQKIKHGSKMDKLNILRGNKIKDILHKISRSLIDYCLKYNIGTIVIGKNDNWKQEANLGKKNNQNFIQIPHFRLIQMIQYKSEEQGIEVILQEESYTSKCSFLDLEPIGHKDQYLGKRFSRGLFKSSNGTIINSDVNGAYNIIRKAIPDAFAKGIEDVGTHPIKGFNSL